MLPTATACLAVAAILAAWAPPAWSQDGPLSEYSAGGVRSGRSMRDGSLTVREGSAGSMLSGPVRGMRQRNPRSGSVGESSVGAARDLAPPTVDDQTIGESSSGAVRKNAGAPLHAPVSQSLTDLRGLQEQLRTIQPLGPTTEPPAPPPPPAPQ